VDGSEVCLSLNQLKTYCARDGAVREAELKLEFSRYEVYED
jgi:phage protein U